MKLKHSDYVTHIKNPEDRDILTRKLFNVNMRLFKTSEQYRNLVLSACDYIKFCCTYEKEGYKKPKGFSGANGAIPFNIIAINVKNNIIVMINPKITKYYGKDIISDSNCGSLTLENPIKVLRKEFIDLEYYNELGKLIKCGKVDRDNGGLTIQHEVDHNLGILITDRVNLPQ